MDYLLSMFKLGDYDEDDASVIAEFLRDAEIKVELKPAIDVSMRSNIYIEGKIGEMKDKVENIEIYERYLEALRRVFPGCESRDDLFERMGAAQDPGWQAKKDELKQLAASEKELLSVADDPINDDEDSSEDNGVEHDGEIKSLDELQERFYEKQKKLYERRNELIESISQNVLGYVFAIHTLEMNDIKFGEEVGSRLDDPVVQIMPTMDNKLTADPDSIKTMEMLEFSKTIAVYIDEISAAMADDLNDDFKDEYGREYARITAIGVFIRDLLFDQPDGKIDTERFIEMCEWQSDEEWGTLYIDGTSVAEDILKTLEKKGIVKIKGDRIKWKKN